MITEGALRAGAARPLARSSEGHLNCLWRRSETKALPSDLGYAVGHLTCPPSRRAKALPPARRYPGRAQRILLPNPCPRLSSTQRAHREGGCKRVPQVRSICRVFVQRLSELHGHLGRVAQAERGRENLITKEIRACTPPTAGKKPRGEGG